MMRIAFCFRLGVTILPMQVVVFKAFDQASISSAVCAEYESHGEVILAGFFLQYLELVVGEI
jgi:hypothetical protein